MLRRWTGNAEKTVITHWKLVSETDHCASSIKELATDSHYTLKQTLITSNRYWTMTFVPGVALHCLGAVLTRVPESLHLPKPLDSTDLQPGWWKVRHARYSPLLSRNSKVIFGGRGSRFRVYRNKTTGLYIQDFVTSLGLAIRPSRFRPVSCPMCKRSQTTWKILA